MSKNKRNKKYHLKKFKNSNKIETSSPNQVGAEKTNNEENQKGLPMNPTPLSRTRILEHSGPLPHPAILEQYDKIQPGLAERIIKMAEEQSKHRQYLEKSIIESDIKNSRTGIYFAFILGILGIIGGVILGLYGQVVPSSVIGGTSLVALVSAFIYGTKSRREERNRKKE